MKKIILSLWAFTAMYAHAQRPLTVGVATNHITFACICGEDWQSNWLPSKLSVGIPLGNKFEVTPSGSFATASYNQKKANSFWNVALDAKYNFTTTRLQPFVMAGASVSNINDGKGSDSYPGLTGGAGLNLWITNGVAITLQENYHRMADYSSDHYFQLAGGITVRLGKYEKASTAANSNSPSADDSDGDGVPDVIDLCRTSPGTPGANGCPDKDQDGVADFVDKCPSDVGPRDTVGCPDTDGDGVADGDDNCPNTPGNKPMIGCPDQDDDRVGDAEDECPTVAGAAEAKGCPDMDADGVADKDDKCPDQAGTLSGCSDKDGDGIADNDDDCPNAKGKSDSKGCPKMTPEEKNQILEHFASVRSNILFETGRNTIRPSLLRSLDQIWAVMVAYPSAMFSIDGHTDIVGSPQKNIALSQLRANVVRDYILAKGQLLPHRVITNALGSNRPISDNETARGRELNRRVEVTLYEK